MAPIRIDVCLVSSRSICLTALPESRVKELKVFAQRAFRAGVLRLFSASGALLDPSSTVQDVGLQDGDVITAVAESVQLAANPWGATMTAFSTSGPVVAWGDESSGVPNNLKGVQQFKPRRMHLLPFSKMAPLFHGAAEEEIVMKWRTS